MRIEWSMKGKKPSSCEYVSAVLFVSCFLDVSFKIDFLMSVCLLVYVLH